VSAAPTLPIPPESGVAPASLAVRLARECAAEATAAGEHRLALAYDRVADARRDVEEERAEKIRQAMEVGRLTATLGFTAWERDRAVAEVGRLRDVMLDAVTALENGAPLDNVIVALSEGCYPGSAK
jgi:hypothetical protein